MDSKRRYCDGSSPTRRVRASREDARGSRARARSSSLARAQPRRVRLDLNARSPRLLPRPRRFPSPRRRALSRVLIDPTLTGIPFVDDHGALRPGQLLEVCGVGGSGKTEILMRAAVNCVMPRERRARRDSADANPASSSSTSTANSTRSDSSKFSPRASKTPSRARGGREEPRGGGELARRRAADDVYALIRASIPDAPMPQLTRLSQGVTRRRTRVRTKRSENAEADRGGTRTWAGVTTEDAGETRAGREGETSAPPPPPPPRRLLLVDNVAAFYWLDRASRRTGRASSLHAVHHASAAKLQELSRRCRAPIIVTKATGGAGGASDAPARPRGNAGDRWAPPRAPRFPPRRWTSAVTQRVVLDVERVAPDGGQPRAREGFEGAGVRGEIRRQVGIAARQTGDAIRGTRR